MKKTSKTKSKTITNPDSLSSLRTKLNTADSEIQYYVSALEEENLKLHKKIAKLQADCVSLNSRITIAEDNTNDRCFHKTLPIECIKEKRIQTKKQIEQLKKEREKLTNVSS